MMKKQAFIILLIYLCLSSLSLQAADKLWSILICTIEERQESFSRIYNKLQHQIVNNHLEDQIEILFFRDNREHSIGFKRNTLLKQSTGEYVCFVDDDDDVHENYIAMIYEKLLQKPDCVNLLGVMTTNGKNPQPFAHSIQYNDRYYHNDKFCSENGIHIRPPNHLNPIKRSVAIQFPFQEANFGEDRKWMIAVAVSGLLKTEAIIDVPYYFYLYDSTKYEKKSEPKKPRVSVITSVYNGDEFIEGFLKDILRQTIFHECEFIIINANSPGNEESIIQQYAAQYPNIIYERLAVDPGVYGVWNYAIKKARADFISNSNIDDRRNPESLEMHAKALEEDPNVDLVYAAVYVSLKANEAFENNSCYWVIDPQDFSPQIMNLCLPGPLPMWRKSVHEKYGFFDESFFSSGDFEFWNRLVSHGVKFKKIPGIAGIYYQNPQGISTDNDPVKTERRNNENQRVVALYRHVWGW